MKKKNLFTLSLLIVLCVPVAHAIDKDVELEFKKIENQLRRANESIEQLLKDVRALQREKQALQKQLDEMDPRVSGLSDDIVKIQNVDLANLYAGQKQLHENQKKLDWGTQERDCAQIGAKHQQVQSVKREDGNLTLRYLCFDGLALHMGTEVNMAP